jgi:predicted nucleic acid-binding protein
MRILLDTSVLVAAMIEAHPMHERALPWLQRVQDGQDVGLTVVTLNEKDFRRVYPNLASKIVSP